MIRPQRLAVAIREVLRVVEILDVGSFSRRAASRIHIAVCGSTGPIDRYSAMPSMNHSGSDNGAVRAGVGVRVGDVVLERVDELVAEHVIGRSIGPANGSTMRRLRRFGDAAGALAQLPFDHVGLPEVRAAGVENERLAAAQLVIEQRPTAARTSARPCRDAIRAASSSSG